MTKKQRKTKTDLHTLMLTAPIPQLTLKLGIPAVLGMLINIIYNTVDTWFVAGLGTLSVGACGISLSIIELIQALGFFFGTGSGTHVGLLLGNDDKEQANTYASTALFFSMIISIFLMVIGLIFLHPLMKALGSSPEMLPYATTYGKYLLMSLPFMSGCIVLETILRCEGNTFYSMVGLSFGAILNLILDPIFIYVLNLKLAGAAIATMTGQISAFFLLLYFFLTGKSQTRLSLKNVKPGNRVLRNMMVTGIPSLCRHTTYALANTCLNIAAGFCGGDSLIALLSIVNRLQNILQAVMKGLFQGAASIFSYNTGAGRHDRVYGSWKFSTLLNTALVCVVLILGFWIDRPLIRLFHVTNEADLKLAALALQLQFLSLLMMPMNFATNNLLQAVGRPMESTILAILPQCFFYIPVLYLGSRFFGTNGVISAVVAAQFFTLLVTIPFARNYFREKLQK